MCDLFIATSNFLSGHLQASGPFAKEMLRSKFYQVRLPRAYDAAMNNLRTAMVINSLERFQLDVGVESVKGKEKQRYFVIQIDQRFRCSAHYRKRNSAMTS